METHLADGFRAVKIRVPTDRARAVEKVRLCREVLGPSTRLMVDAGDGIAPGPVGRQEPPSDLARAIEPFDIAWLEDALRRRRL